VMLGSRAWTGGPGTHQSIGGGTWPSIWRWGHLDLQWLPLQRGQGLDGPGAVSWAVPFLGILCKSAPPVHNYSKLGI
jgi:hypothetical protein